MENKSCEITACPKCYVPNRDGTINVLCASEKPGNVHCDSCGDYTIDELNKLLIDAMVDDALPSEHFAFGPYRAEHFAYDNSGVMNKNGFNCLSFKSKPGAVFTTIEIAEKIAEKWNNDLLSK